MALLAHQKISYVLPGKPYGRGTLGAYSSATAPTMTKDSCSGTAASNTLTTAGSTFANGDLLKIIQMRGTGAGQWEIALVSSGGGSTSLTLSKALTYTYTDSVASQAQAIKINEYTNVTVQSGTWTPPSWDGNTGGVLTFACKGTLTPTGTISINGANSSGTTGAGATVGGFRGGNPKPSDATGYSYCGEGSAGDRAQQNTTNGNGGGGVNVYATRDSGRSGGGGSYGSAGTAGGGGGNTNGGGGASTVGDANLQTIFMGGGGGGGGVDGSGAVNGGGSGGGIVSIYANTIFTINSITVNGGGSDNSTYACGGGGAGGSILICSNIIDIGTDKIRATGGVGGYSSVWGHYGGNGGKGRIAVYYGSSLTGSVSSTYYGSLTTAADQDFIFIENNIGSPLFFRGGAVIG